MGLVLAGWLVSVGTRYVGTVVHTRHSGAGFEVEVCYDEDSDIQVSLLL